MTNEKRTRPVRTDSGAIFDVDPSMVDAEPKSGDYRASSAPPNVSAIVPAPTRRIPVLAIAALVVFVLFAGAVVLVRLRG